MLRHATTREEYVAALTFSCHGIDFRMLRHAHVRKTRMLRHAHVRKTAEPLNQAETLKNHHLIMAMNFKMIPN